MMGQGAGDTYCPIPTGTDLVELTDANTRMLGAVGIWLQQTSNSGNPSITTVVELLNGDYDSTAYCECDYEDRSGTNGFFHVQLDQAGDAGVSSPGCSAATCTGWTSSWDVTAYIFSSAVTGQFVGVNQLVAADTAG